MKEELIDEISAGIAQIIVLFIKALVIMIVWNMVLPNLFSVVPAISYWQAFGLHILFIYLSSGNELIVRYLKKIYYTKL